jgi:hypothetical protein
LVVTRHSSLERLAHGGPELPVVLEKQGQFPRYGGEAFILRWGIAIAVDRARAGAPVGVHYESRKSP